MTCNTIMTRLAVLACFNLSFCSMGTPVGNMPTTATKGHRETLSLTGEWGFRSDQNREGDVRGWGDWKYFTGTWRQVRVPITFDDCAPGMQGFRGVSRDRTHKHQGFFTVQKWFPELQKMHAGVRSGQ